MKKIALAAVALASLGLVACEARTNENGSTTITADTNLSELGNAAEDLAEGAGNALDKAGDAVGNVASSAANEVSDAAGATRNEVRDEAHDAEAATNAARR